MTAVARVFTLLITFAVTNVNVHGQDTEVIDRTRLEICFVNNTEDLSWDLEFEGYKSAGS